MRIFVFEFITGGGLFGLPLPPSLAQEGERMLQAVIADLLDLQEVDKVIISRDPRLPALPAAVHTLAADHPDVIALFEQGVAAADAVWPIAPETDGVLERLSRIVLGRGKRLIGCLPDAVAIAASKSRTAEALSAAGIVVVPAYRDPDALPSIPGPWVVKPDDGAGCADTLQVADRAAAAELLAARAGAGLIAQPWIAGDAQSQSLWYGTRADDFLVLSRNRQHIRIHRQQLSLDALTVAALPVEDAHRTLARRIAQAVPGLRGYVGIDFIETPAGPVLVEINPRLTTAYCGLRRALGINVAALALAAGELRQFEFRPHGSQTVELRLAPDHA